MIINAVTPRGAYRIALLTARGWEYDDVRDQWSKDGHERVATWAEEHDRHFDRNRLRFFDLDDAFDREAGL
jgi:hypothetical protein